MRVPAATRRGDPRGRPKTWVGTSPALTNARQNPTVGAIVGAFKSITTVEYIRRVSQKNWIAFDRRLWQRNYYEHIIRNEDALHRIREYIQTNPLRWALDRENPRRIGVDEFDIWLHEYCRGARRDP